MNRLLHSFLALIAVLMLLVSCAKDTPPEPEKQHTAAVTELISLMDANPSVKALLEKSISQAASINPDRRYNPAQSLDEFYEFVDWNIRQLPWEVMITASPTEYGQSLYGRTDQGVGYFWFIADQPLDELKGRGYYYPTVEFVEPFASWPKELWEIGEDNQLVYPADLQIKTAKLSDIGALIGEGSAYRDAFAGGTLTHTFLDVNDYHRYHAPVSGTLRELRNIPGVAAGGGYTMWDNESKLYYYSNDMGFQMVETRSCAIIETEEFGLVAMMPVGMSQICSCNWLPALKVGDHIEQGQEMGYFLFGGSDIVMIFQKDVNVQLLHDGDHLLMGQAYANLEKKQTDKMKIQVSDGSQIVVFELNETPVAKSLYDQLPITVDVENYSNNEKIFYPPTALSVTGGVEGDCPVGTLAYFSPWKNVVMYYGAASRYSGLYLLGAAVEGKDRIKDLSGKITVSKL